jgi:hypothetical protein
MIRKPSPTAKSPGKPRKPSQKNGPLQGSIAASLAALDQLEPESRQAKALVALIRTWLSDQSGYDETTWPELRKSLDSERRRRGARRLFNG